MNKALKMTFVGLEFFATLAILLAIVAGCKDSGGDPPPVTNTVDLHSYMPLKMGDRWVYRTIRATDTGPPDTTFAPMRVAETTYVQGRACLNIEGDAVPFLATDRANFLAADQNDISMYICVGCLSSSKTRMQFAPMTGWQPIHLLKTPLAKSTTWRSADWDTSFAYFSVLATDTTVSVPAGTFSHCVVAGSRSATSVGDSTIIFAPGVGIIKSGTATSGTLMTSELMSYSVH